METVETLSLLVYPSYSMSMEGKEAMIYITDCTLLYLTEPDRVKEKDSILGCHVYLLLS